MNRTTRMLTHWDPFRSLQHFERATAACSPARAWSPAANISKDESGYVLRFDVPGVSKDQVDIDIDGGVLVVSGERKSSTENGDAETYYKMESFSGRFRRSFRLPEDADTSSVTATYKDGVLTVRVPQAEAARARKVEIADA